MINSFINIKFSTRQKDTIKMISKTIISSAVALLLASVGHKEVLAKGSEALYDHISSDVTVLNKLNFEKQVSKNREKGISIVHFYKDEGKHNYHPS